MGFYQNKHSQHFNSSIDELWDFISSPTNLKLITPDYMGFDIVSKDLHQFISRITLKSLGIKVAVG